MAHHAHALGVYHAQALALFNGGFGPGYQLLQVGIFGSASPSPTMGMDVF